MIVGIPINHKKLGNTIAFDEISSPRRKKIVEKTNINSISSVYTACISKRMGKWEELLYKAKGFKF